LPKKRNGRPAWEATGGALLFDEIETVSVSGNERSDLHNKSRIFARQSVAAHMFSATQDAIDPGMTKLRSLDEAVADLSAKYEKLPSADLARMIEQLQAEIAVRNRPS
jgi:hypothetical protein